MTQDTWTAVDAYFEDKLFPDDPVQDATLQAMRDAHLAPINVTAAQGKFLMLLAKAIGARRVLEIGTLGGYSTIWLARGLPGDGRIITMEIDPATAGVARANIERAGFGDMVEIRVGRAVDSLQTLHDDAPEPFDLIFIDADKPSNVDYVTWGLRLSRPGTVITIDNVVRNGEVTDPSSTDASVQGVRALMDFLENESRLMVTALQTVGGKGYDGFAMALVDE
jgi:predicted O-methyltransferase YrrM